MKRIPRPSWASTLSTPVIVSLVAIALALVSLILVMAVDRTEQRDTATDNAVGLAEQVAAACAGPSIDDAALADLCKRAGIIADDPSTVTEGPVVGPPGPQGEPGERGEQGDSGPGPTPEQVEAAVATYCADGRCAESPSSSQVEAAVVAYCSSGACDGPAGARGDAGPAGKDGQPGASVEGPAGPAPTAAQISQAVADYCVANVCGSPGPAGPAGPEGEPGEPGASGAPGRGVVELACRSTPEVGTTEITVTYSDGTTQVVACEAL